MASFRRHGDAWRAEVFRRGVRRSQIFQSKGAAVAWAGTVEAEIMAGHRGEVPNLTVQALLERYSAEVSEGKKGKRWEQIRLKALGRDRLALVRLRLLDAPHVSDWQKRRLEAVSSASVRRERNLLNNVFNVAVDEWKWLAKNPFGSRGKGVRRPKDGKARKRIASPAEIAKLNAAASPELRRAIVAALETGMRASEVASQPEIRGRVAVLVDSKNGEAREVPLSAKALECFPIALTAGSISGLFARLCREEGVKGLTYHDLRATAATRLSKVLNPLQLAKMFGWKDLKQAMVYYRESTEDVAKLL